MSEPVPLTVIMPAYNEEGAIERAVSEVRAEILDTVEGSQLVVVDDGSRDTTGGILDRLSAADPRVRVIHKPNAGHGPALRTGLDAATGYWCLLLDSDLQIPLGDFKSAWEKSRERDAVIGIRVNRHEPWIRVALTAALRTTVPVLFGLRLRDPNVPFKLFRRWIWVEAKELIPADSVTPSILLGVYLKRNYRVVETIVPHRPRDSGVTFIRRWKMVQFSWSSLVQLIRFRLRLLGQKQVVGR